MHFYHRQVVVSLHMRIFVGPPLDEKPEMTPHEDHCPRGIKMDERTPSKPSGQYGYPDRVSVRGCIRELKPRVPYTQKKERGREESATRRRRGIDEGGQGMRREGRTREKDAKRDRETREGAGREEEGLT